MDIGRELGRGRQSHTARSRSRKLDETASFGDWAVKLNQIKGKRSIPMAMYQAALDPDFRTKALKTFLMR
ncbi:MAG: hypothetical protein ACRC2T_18630 [Thermoguttaceae bacterium]